MTRWTTSEIGDQSGRVAPVYAGRTGTHPGLPTVRVSPGEACDVRPAISALPAPLPTPIAPPSVGRTGRSGLPATGGGLRR